MRLGVGGFVDCDYGAWHVLIYLARFNLNHFYLHGTIGLDVYLLALFYERDFLL
jgi:hypothetical protein